MSVPADTIAAMTDPWDGNLWDGVLALMREQTAENPSPAHECDGTNLPEPGQLSQARG
jgi:hypothetical protein